MRFPASIITFILGLLLAGIGVGLLTVWASDEVPTAQTQQVDEAPLTVISDDLIDEEAQREEFMISAEGEYTLALARTQDIEAWVGDAAHVTIGAVQEGQDDAEATIETQFVEGEATVPDPADSDLWVASETTEGDLRYGWSAPDDSGDWSLLMFRDGEQPAPSTVSVELEEESDHLVGTVLIVLGALLVLLGLFLFLRSRKSRDAKRGEKFDRREGKNRTAATTGIGSAPSAAASGTESSGTAQGIAGVALGAATVSTNDAAEDDSHTVEGDTDTAATGHDETGTLAASTEDEMTHQPHTTDADPTEVHPQVPTEEPRESSEDPDATGIIEPIDSDPADADTLHTEAPEAQNPEDGTDGTEGRTWRSRSVATAAALSLALSPAVLASDAEPTPGESEQTEDVEADEVEPDDDAGYSVLLESQLQGIIDDIAEHTTEADEAFDAELLAPRVSGNAETVRELTYRNHELDEDVMPDAIGTEILSAAVTSGSDFPRQAVVITQEAEAEIPQVLVIEQASPRENYELIQSVLMVPGTEFPAISAEDGGVESVDPTEEEAVFAANHAMERTAVFLNNSEYYFGNNVEDNAYIEDLQAYQDELRESAEDLEISYTRPLIGEGSTAMRLPDGSVLAVGSFDSTTQLRPEDGASINFSGVSAELAETESTTADADIINRESMILHIPAENDEKVVVLGVHDIVNEVNILD
ncbi:hypothetical protein [Nesterenkonia halotolerans]|uniref:Uncharacterized protein n=1 Tax=Nesterenkonia halotolerans TaxID=225325 RepID=A0ABR9J3B4_9MICC|nr:hypothetical protein [Nesterenkonia halotolerans]MBE1513327.1 hypothetical protein [Nesterenkonia halotolerans]